MLVIGAMNASAQLTVYHNGNVNIGSEQLTSNVSLSVGNVAYSDTTYHEKFNAVVKCNGASFLAVMNNLRKFASSK